MLKNIPLNEALVLTELVPYQAGQVVSRTLSQNPHVSVTLFAFDKGEEISAHDSRGDALALVKELDLPLTALPAAGQEDVEQGMGFSTLEELEQWLENMES